MMLWSLEKSSFGKVPHLLPCVCGALEFDWWGIGPVSYKSNLISLMIMDDPLASPRKKVKMGYDHTCSMDGAADAGGNHPTESSSLGLPAPKDQASIEIACGITEFVSPDLPGFSGMFKKRYRQFHGLD